MSVERIIVIDPGQRVGWCRATIVDGIIDPESFAVGVHPLKVFAEALIGRTIVPAACDGEVEYDRLVFEKWFLYANKTKELIGSEMESSQLIGIIRACGWISGAKLTKLAADKKETGRVAAKHDNPWLLEKLERCSEEHSKDAILLLSYYHYATYVKGKR